jgi:hypothetical protein
MNAHDILQLISNLRQRGSSDVICTATFWNNETILQANAVNNLQNLHHHNGGKYAGDGCPRPAPVSVAPVAVPAADSEGHSSFAPSSTSSPNVSMDALPNVTSSSSSPSPNNLVNPVGVPNYVEITGVEAKPLSNVLECFFRTVPDSLILPRSDVTVIDDNNGVIRSISAFTVIGTAILHTSLYDMHQCMPFFAQQHPSLYDPISRQPTLLSSVITTMSSLLANVPLSLTLDVGIELDGYVIAHFDKETNKIFRAEFHYFITKTKAFPTTFK